jgi:hypothetical protein
MIKYLLCILMMSFSLFSSENMYVASHEIVISGNSIYAHLQDNVWVKTNAVNCDEKGVYIKYDDHFMYERWYRCPRCGSFYDSFGDCTNPSCGY